MKKNLIPFKKHGLWLTMLILALSATACEKDARAVWQSVIKKCAVNDLLGDHVLYFGPSNNLGPGTIFQKFPSDNSIQVSHRISEYAVDPDSFINIGQTFSCLGTSASSFDMDDKLSLESALSISGELGLDLKKAKTISVKTDSIQWIDLVTGRFRDEILALDDSHSVRNDLLNNRHLVLSRALKVRGMSAELNFTQEIGASLKAKYPNMTDALSAEIGLSCQWEGSTKIVISSSADFYIAGELRRFEATGLAGRTDRIGPKELNLEKTRFIKK